jgi:hypothetical protein
MKRMILIFAIISGSMFSGQVANGECNLTTSLTTSNDSFLKLKSFAEIVSLFEFIESKKLYNSILFKNTTSNRSSQNIRQQEIDDALNDLLTKNVQINSPNQSIKNKFNEYRTKLLNIKSQIKVLFSKPIKYIKPTQRELDDFIKLESSLKITQQEITFLAGYEKFSKLLETILANLCSQFPQTF